VTSFLSQTPSNFANFWPKNTLGNYRKVMFVSETRHSQGRNEAKFLHSQWRGTAAGKWDLSTSTTETLLQTRKSTMCICGEHNLYLWSTQLIYASKFLTGEFVSAQKFNLASKSSKNEDFQLQYCTLGRKASRKNIFRRAKIALPSASDCVHSKHNQLMHIDSRSNVTFLQCMAVECWNMSYKLWYPS